MRASRFCSRKPMVNSAFRSTAVALGLICAVLAAEPLDAQNAPRPGTLRLIIRDATDLAVTGAVVTLSESAGGPTRTAAANERGEAIFDNLPPGEYIARVESPGFTPVQVNDLRV